MKISKLQIDGFGVWSGLELSALDEPLVVFYGENEAGKTTLMQFVRNVLYGFSPERRKRFLPPVKTGRAGGSLRIEESRQQFVLGRWLDLSSGQETLEVTESRGEARELRVLELLLGGVDEAVFSSIFAFGLHEIQQLATLSDHAAADLLYQMTLGVDRVSLADVVRQLNTSRQRYLSDDEQQGEILKLADEQDRLRDEIRGLSDATTHFLDLIGQKSHLDGVAERLAAEETELDEHLRMLGLAAQLEARWRSRQALADKLSALGPIPQIPEDTLSQLEELKARRTTRNGRLEQVTSRRKELNAEVDRLKINETLCRHAPRLEALAEQQQWIASLDEDSKRLESELALLTSQQKSTGGELPAISKPLSSQIVAALRSQGKELAALRRRARTTSVEVTAARQKVAEQKAPIHAALFGRGEESLSEALEKAGQNVSLLRRRVQIDQRLEQLDRRLHQLQEQADESLDRQLLPTWQVIGLGVIFVLSVALTAGGMLLPTAWIGPAGWPMAFLGIAGLGIAVGTKYFASHAAEKQLENCQKNLAQIREETAAAQRERDELDATLPKGGGPLVTRLQTAEAELARLEELMPLDAQYQTALRALRAARQQRHDAIEGHKRTRQRWRQTLREAGLPETLTLQQLRGFVERGSELQALAERVTKCRTQLTDSRRQHEILTERIWQVAEDVRLRSEGVEPLPTLREMLRQLQDEQLRAELKAGLQAQLKKSRRVRGKLVRQVTAIDKRIDDLIRASAGRDEDDLRRKVTLKAEIQRLSNEHDALAREIDQALTGCGHEHIIADHLEAGDDLRKLSDGAVAAKQDLRTRLGQTWAQRGALAEQINSSSADRRLSQKRMELTTIGKRLNVAIQRWQVLASCSLAMEAVREKYERERQPEVLREASVYLAKLTADRYKRIWTPLDRRELRIEDAEGKPLAIDVLSRGTREQIFLSLRLALVATYARRGIRLPVVMDDVLVNFDATRAKAAVEVLRDFARQGHQLLVFTCHEHLAQLFHNAKVAVRQLSGNILWRDEPAEEKPPIIVSPPVRSVPPPHFLPDSRKEPPADEETLLVIEDETPEPPTPSVVEFRIVAEPSPPARNGRKTRPRRSKPVAEPTPVIQEVRSVEWSAEEFAGELADRVRSEVPVVEPVEGQVEEAVAEPEIEQLVVEQTIVAETLVEEPIVEPIVEPTKPTIFRPATAEPVTSELVFDEIEFDD